MATDYSDLGFTPAAQPAAQTQAQASASNPHADLGFIPAPAVPSALEAGARGALQGASLGFGDELTGGGEALLDKITGGDQGKSFSDLYSQHTAEARAANEAAQKAHPYVYGAGNLAGGAASGLVTGGLGAETALARVGVAAGLGAVGGVGYGNAQDLHSGAEDALKGAAIGGVVGGAVEGVTSALNPENLEGLANNARVRSLNPNTPQYKQILANEARYAEYGNNAVGDAASMEAGNAAESALPVTNPIGTRASIAQTMADHDIGGPFSSLSGKAEQFAAVNESAGKGIGELMQNLDQAGVPAFSPQDLSGEIMEKFGAPLEGFKSKSGAFNTIADLAEDIKNNFSGDDFQTAQSIKNFVKDQTNFDSTRSQSANDTLKQVYGYVKGKLEQAVDQGAESIGDPDILKEYLKNKRDFGNSEIAENILNGSTAREAANQRIGLGTKVLAAGELAAGNPIKAAATAGVLKGAAAFGRNIEAATAAKLADIVRSAPESLGPWAKQLSDAAARGATSLGATNFILQQSSPEYRNHMRQLFDNQ